MRFLPGNTSTPSRRKRFVTAVLALLVTLIWAIIANYGLDVATWAVGGADPWVHPWLAKPIVLNVLVIWLAILLVLAITGRLWLTLGITGLITLSLAVIHLTKLRLRNDPLVPADTAFLAQPDFLVDMVGKSQVVMAVVGMVLIVVISWLMGRVVSRWLPHIATGMASKPKWALRLGRLVVAGGPLGAVTMPGTGTTAVSMPGGGSISVASFDSSSAVGSVYTVVGKAHPDIFNKDWRMKEKVTTLFSKADVDTELFGLPVRGNIGLQLVNTDQSSTAFSIDRKACTDAGDVACASLAKDNTAGAKYNDVLPSLNLATDFGDAGTVRVAIARVMARPKVDDMRASFGFGLNTTDNILDGSGGNPKLKPFRANALDVSYEKFWGTKAYVGVAAFYKDLASYIVNVTNPTFDFSPYITPSTVLPARPNAQIGKFTQPVNGSGGSISGIEISGSFPLNMATSMLDGFGFFASYSNTSSTLNLTTASVATDGVNTGKIPLPGLSKTVTNYGVYFEKWGFSARVAARSRSDFVGEVADFAGDRRLTYIKGETITDAQIGYEFQSGFLKGLAIRAEISNANNTPFVRYRDDITNEIENKKDGKFYQVGLNYKF